MQRLVAEIAFFALIAALAIFLLWYWV